MQDISDKYAGDSEVAVVSIQTVFEGFGVNSKEALHTIASRYSLAIPLGHNGGPKNPSPLLFSYRARGTPWVVIIDREGKIRYGGFYQPVKESIALIETLKREKNKQSDQ